MIAFIATLIILAIAVWFYQNAQKLGLPGLAWAVGGVIVYYGGFLFWMHAVLRPVLGGLYRNHGFWVGVGMDATSIAFGVACAALFHYKVLLKKGRKNLKP